MDRGRRHVPSLRSALLLLPNPTHLYFQLYFVVVYPRVLSWKLLLGLLLVIVSLCYIVMRRYIIPGIILV